MEQLQPERGWMNRCPLSSSLFGFETLNEPAHRTPSEKFQMQANNASIELSKNLGYMTAIQGKEFMETIVEKAKDLETLNGGALALLYPLYDGKSIRPKKCAEFLKSLPSNKRLQKFIQEYGITPKDLIRYVRFYDNLEK